MLLLALAAAAAAAGARRWADGPPPARRLARSAESADDADLDLLLTTAAELEALAADCDRASDPGRVYDFSIRWGTYLSGRLRRLEYRDRAGALGTPEKARYEQLRRRLQEVAPAARRLGLAQPAVVEDGTRRAARHRLT